MRLKHTSVALLLAAVLSAGATQEAAAGPAPPQPPILVTMGGPIFVKFLGFEATLRSELWFFGINNPGPSQTPPVASATYLFANKNPAASQVPGMVGTPPTGPTTSIGTFPPGTELAFGLFVQDLWQQGHVNPGNGTRHGWFYTGLPGQNFDGRVHAIVNQVSANRYVVGFEDLCRTSSDPELDPVCWNTRFMTDWDYNDHMFEITMTPEPVSMALLGTGLVGMGVVRRRRKKAQDVEETL